MATTTFQNRVNALCERGTCLYRHEGVNSSHLLEKKILASFPPKSHRRDEIMASHCPKLRPHGNATMLRPHLYCLRVTFGVTVTLNSGISFRGLGFQVFLSGGKM